MMYGAKIAKIAESIRLRKEECKILYGAAEEYPNQVILQYSCQAMLNCMPGPLLCTP